MTEEEFIRFMYLHTSYHPNEVKNLLRKASSSGGRVRLAAQKSGESIGTVKAWVKQWRDEN